MPRDRRPHTPLADTRALRGSTSRASRCAIPACPRRCAAPTPAWPSDAAIAHLQRLGVTAVSLLPVHQHLDEQRLVAQGPVQLLGLQHARLLLPSSRATRAAPAGCRRAQEFRAMVRAAARGRHRGDPRRGLQPHRRDRRRAARRSACAASTTRATTARCRGEPGIYDNLTGCGNTLDLRHPRVLQLVMDSLRYWAGEMDVDGFRFDLAPVLGRGEHGFDRARRVLLSAVAQDPVLAGVKLIAEPWDLGPGGYQLGRFPRGWLEWNDRFRDAMRSFWLGGGVDPRRVRAAPVRVVRPLPLARPRAGRVGQLHRRARRLHAARPAQPTSTSTTTPMARTTATATAHNHSWNCGVEGPTDDAAGARAARAAAARAAGHAAARAGHADAVRRRRTRPQPGRQQQSVLPGQPDHLDRLGRRPTRRWSRSRPA